MSQSQDALPQDRNAPAHTLESRRSLRPASRAPELLDLVGSAREIGSAEPTIPSRCDRRLTQADAAVWSGRLPDIDAGYEEPARRLLSRLRSVYHDRQMVHGDIAGNVLRRTDGSRMIIDYSPYFWITAANADEVRRQAAP